MPNDIKRIRLVAAIVALASVPAFAAAQNPPSTRDSLGASGTAGAPSMSTPPNSTSASGTAAGANGGYAVPNAAQSPAMGTDTSGLTTQESGGDVDTNRGGGSKWGWLGLLGLIGLAGMRRRHTTVETSTTGRRL